MIFQPPVYSDSWLWSTGETTPYINIESEGNYWLEVKIKHCTFRDTVKATDYSYSKLFIPNSFTPNNDGYNDCFSPIGNGTLDYQFHIFNKWGGLLYESKDVNDCWDGKFKNNNVNEGIYIWIINYSTHCSDKTIVQYGSLHLMR